MHAYIHAHHTKSDHTLYWHMRLRNRLDMSSCLCHVQIVIYMHIYKIRPQSILTHETQTQTRHEQLSFHDFHIRRQNDQTIVCSFTWDSETDSTWAAVISWVSHLGKWYPSPCAADVQLVIYIHTYTHTIQNQTTLCGGTCDSDSDWTWAAVASCVSHFGKWYPSPCAPDVHGKNHRSQFLPNTCMHAHMHIAIVIYVFVCMDAYVCICTWCTGTKSQKPVFAEHKHISTYLHMYICTYAHMHICTLHLLCMCMCVRMYLCMYPCMCVWVYACMHACMHVRMCVYDIHTHSRLVWRKTMHVTMYICMYIYTPASGLHILHNIVHINIVYYICMYVTMYVCVYVTVYICMYIYTPVPSLHIRQYHTHWHRHFLGSIDVCMSIYMVVIYVCM